MVSWVKSVNYVCPAENEGFRGVLIIIRMSTRMFRMSVVRKALVNKADRCNISQRDYVTIAVVYATITRGTIPAGYLKSLYKYTASFGLSARGAPDKICSSKIWSTRSLVEFARDARATPQFKNRKDNARRSPISDRLALSSGNTMRIGIKGDGAKAFTGTFFHKNL